MGKAKRYYDPGTNPFPPHRETMRHFDPTTLTNGEPTANTRQQRRQRARLPFAEQHRMAKLMGFDVPLDAAFVAPDSTPADQQVWIANWERAYADR